MSATDDALKANQKYASAFDRADLAVAPAKKLAVLACMDARLTVADVLGLNDGDAHVIRNAGGIATEDALRSLIVSHHLLGTREVIVINHTECGMLNLNDQDLLSHLEEKTGAVASVDFHTFQNLEDNVRLQVARINGHPYLQDLPVRGFIYDVKTGKLHEVTGAPTRAAHNNA
jgi:carbonic anhydrase